MDKHIKDKFLVIAERIKRDKKLLLTVVLGLTGILMIFASEISFSETETDSKVNEHSISKMSSDELEEIIESINGAGKTKVIITYEGTSENVYARNYSSQSKENDEKRDEEHIILDTGSDEDGLLVKKIFPKVTGVAVVCRGGNNPIVKNEITQLLKALFDIGSNNISITEMCE